MPNYRTALPQCGNEPFLTDGGLETTLIFHQGQELPHFAAFHLMRSADGEQLILKKAVELRQHSSGAGV